MKLAGMLQSITIHKPEWSPIFYGFGIYVMGTLAYENFINVYVTIYLTDISSMSI
jgi:hypothetical protein